MEHDISRGIDKIISWLSDITTNIIACFFILGNINNNYICCNESSKGFHCYSFKEWFRGSIPRFTLSDIHHYHFLFYGIVLEVCGIEIC